MKKRLLLLQILIFTLYTLQAQQPPNAGFEAWEDVGTVVDEPVKWSSIKTSDGGEFINNAAPQVWDQSTDAHTGNYSVKLTNKTQFGIVANGTITSGRIHIHPALNPDSSSSFTVIGDDRWSNPFTYRPDSVAGWYKFYPQGDDTCQVKVLLHVGEGSIPAFTTQPNWVGMATFKSPNQVIDTWTRFSAPFEYFDGRTPEYLLMICNIEEANQATEGSIVYYDDLEFIYNNASIGETENLASLMYYSQGQVYLDKIADDKLSGAVFTLSNTLGQVLISQNVTGKQITVAQKGLNPGIYIASLVIDGYQSSTKIFIE